MSGIIAPMAMIASTDWLPTTTDRLARLRNVACVDGRVPKTATTAAKIATRPKRSPTRARSMRDLRRAAETVAHELSRSVCSITMTANPFQFPVLASERQLGEAMSRQIGAVESGDDSAANHHHRAVAHPDELLEVGCDDDGARAVPDGL